MRRAHRTTALAATVIVAGACNGLTFDVDSVRLADADPADADAGALPRDAAFVEDATDALPDLGRDVDVIGDVGLDAADGADTGSLPPECAVAQPIDPQRCDPTLIEGCPTGGHCNLRVNADFELQLLCGDSETGTGTRGDSCRQVADCALTFTCFDWSFQSPDPRGAQCAKFCVLETNEGCRADEFCTSAPAVPNVEGYGWCTPRCDPYDAAACPEGQTCSIDFNYPESTCVPEFRCVAVSDAQRAGATCGPGAQVATCARGLTCYELSPADFECVQPCADDASCSGGQVCAPPAGPWKLRFCQ